MTLHIPLADALAFLLAFVRATSFLWLSPPLSNAAVPPQAKIAIAAGLAVAAVPAVSHDALPLTTAGFIEALVIQITVGALIGLVVQMFVGAVQGAGTLIDQFSGLNLPPTIDPLNLDQSPLLAELYEWIATVLLFASGAEVLLAEGFLKSFTVVGTTVPHAVIAKVPNLLSADLVAFFAASAEIAAPLVAVVFVAQILLGLLAKCAPQANVFALGFPLQLALVLIGLALAVVALPSDVANLLDRGIAQLVGS